MKSMRKLGHVITTSRNPFALAVFDSHITELEEKFPHGFYTSSLDRDPQLGGDVCRIGGRGSRVRYTVRSSPHLSSALADL